MNIFGIRFHFNWFRFSYKHQAEITSERFRDNLVSPMETAVFWIEYIAATKGAPHLQSIAAHFSTYTYYNFDVWIFYAFAIILMIFVLWKSVSLIMSLQSSFEREMKRY